MSDNPVLTSVMLGRYIKNIQEVQDGAAKITAIAWSHNNMKLAVCTADRVLLRLSQSSAIISVTRLFFSLMILARRGTSSAPSRPTLNMGRRVTLSR